MKKVKYILSSLIIVISIIAVLFRNISFSNPENFLNHFEIISIIYESLMLASSWCMGTVAIISLIKVSNQKNII